MLQILRFISYCLGAIAFYLAGSHYLHLVFTSIGLVAPTVFSNGSDTLSNIVALLLYWRFGVPYLTFFWNEVAVKLSKRLPLATVAPTAATRWFLWLMANFLLPIVVAESTYILMWEYLTAERMLAAYVGLFCFCLTGGFIFNAAYRFNVQLIQAGR